MNTAREKPSNSYINVPKTKLCDEPKVHESLRRDCERLWTSKAPGYDFRLVRSSSWSTHGRGTGYYWLRKFGNTFVIGQRRGSVSADEYPQLKSMNASYPMHVDTTHLPQDLLPADVFFWHNPFFIVKPTRTLVPTMIDAGRNNMLWGMRLFRYVMRTDSSLLSSTMMFRRKGALIGGDYSGMPKVYLEGMLEFSEDQVFTLGNTIFDPVLQVYDHGLYNKGREALFALHDLLKIYIDRHGILEKNNSWYESAWPPDFMWSIIQRYYKKGIPGLSPHWVLDCHVRDNNVSYTPRWMADRAHKLSQPSKDMIRKYWKREAFRLGIVRFVERGTPLYNEVPPMEPPQIDYDRLIRAKN